MSHIHFRCPNCRQPSKVTADRAGALVECPHCRTRLRIPAPPAATPSAVAPPPDPRMLVEDWLDRWENDGHVASPDVLERFVQEHCREAPSPLVEEFRAKVRALTVMELRLRPGLESSQDTRQTGAELSRTTPCSIPSFGPGMEVIPGYRLERLLGQGGFGQVWKAGGPGGFAAALKFVPLAQEHADIEEQALEIMKEVRHPHLLSVFGTWKEHRRLIIGMELAECTLRDRMREAQAEGYPGIPRTELLVYLGEAAKALDSLNQPRPQLGDRAASGLQHRDIKPENLLLLGGSIKVGDFGLIHCLRHTITAYSGALTLAYAPTEFFNGQTSRHSDQYSLAVTYCELRGGTLPFTGNIGQVTNGHLNQPPDLNMVPPEERPALARALAKSPRCRWPSCAAFVAALCLAEPALPQRYFLGRVWRVMSAPWRRVFRPHGQG